MPDSTIRDGQIDADANADTAIPSGDPDVRAAAADPASIAVDGVSVTNRSVAETIAADRHLSGKNAAAKNNNFGIGLRRIIPGSSVGQ